MNANPQENIFNSFFLEKNLIYDLKSKTKKIIIHELVTLLHKNYKFDLTAKKITDEFMERENKGSTGMQNGIAIPHIKNNCFDRFYLAVGIHRQGCDYQAIDNQPTHVILLLIAPLCESQTYLKFISIISRLFLNKNFKDEIFKIKTQNELCKFFNSYFS